MWSDVCAAAQVTAPVPPHAAGEEDYQRDYERLRDAIHEHLEAFVQDGDADEPMLYIEAVERASKAIPAAAQDRKIIDRLRAAGNALSNCAYNLAQPSQTLTDNDRTVLKRSQEDWDKAVLSHPAEETPSAYRSVQSVMDAAGTPKASPEVQHQRIDDVVNS